MDPSTRLLTQLDVAPFVDHLRTWGLAEATLTAYASDLTGLFSEVGPIWALKFNDRAAGYLTAHRAGWANSTVRRKLATFNKFARWVGVDDLSHYRRPSRTDMPEHDTIAMAEIRAVLSTDPTEAENPDDLLDHCNAWIMIALCGLGGLRAHEAASVVFGDFSVKSSDTIHLHVTTGKGGGVRGIPFPLKAYERIREVHEAMHPFNEASRVTYVSTLTGRKRTDHLRYRMKEYMTWNLGRRVESHALRHCYATTVFNASKDIILTQKLLGHADVSTTQRYVSTSMDAKEAVVRELFTDDEETTATA